MRNLITYQLFENIDDNTKVYHGSTKKFDVGFVLTPQGYGYAFMDSEKEIEDIFERLRPKNKLSRKNCVYLVSNIDEVDNAGGYTDYIYEVDPIGVVQKSDLAWYTNVAIIISDKYKEEDIIESVNNYWQGVQYKNKEHSLFEYRCMKAKIVDIVE